MILTKATQNAQQSADKCSSQLLSQYDWVKSHKTGAILSRSVSKHWNCSLALLHLSFYNKTTSSDFIISFRQHFQADSILSGVLFSVLKVFLTLLYVHTVLKLFINQ